MTETSTVTSTVVEHWTENTNGYRLRNRRIISHITNGAPVLRLYVDTAGVNVTDWLLDDIIIEGNGQEGNGIEIVCARNDSWIYRGCLRDIDVSGCGGHGLLLDGSVFESALFNVQLHDNKGSGGVFQHDGGGQVSAISMHGCNMRKNGAWGLQTLNGTRDVKQFGGYYCQNGGGGLNANQGFTILSGVGFENNTGNALYFQNYGNCFGCTFSTGGVQATQIGGTLAGNMTLMGVDYEDYGAGTSVFMNVNGSGTILMDHAAGNSTLGPSVHLVVVA